MGKFPFPIYGAIIAYLVCFVYIKAEKYIGAN